jgi:hypothetical protein
MKYKVTGAHRGTGARMTLEFEADSKAAAERKATQAGMNVHRVADADGDQVDPVDHVALGTGGRRTGMHPVLKLIILLAIVAALWFFVVGPIVRARM